MAVCRDPLRISGPRQVLVRLLLDALPRIFDPRHCLERPVLHRATGRRVRPVRPPEPPPCVPRNAVIDPLADHEVHVRVRRLTVRFRVARVDRVHERKLRLRQSRGYSQNQLVPLRTGELVRERHPDMHEKAPVRALVQVRRREQLPRVGSGPYWHVSGSPLHQVVAAAVRALAQDVRDLRRGRLAVSAAPARYVRVVDRHLLEISRCLAAHHFWNRNGDVRPCLREHNVV